MAYKQFLLDDLTVTVYKRKTSRQLRLSVSPHGKVQVSIPTWLPYKTGVEFARSRQAWISSQLPAGGWLQNGQAIGKAHHLHFAASPQPKITSRLGMSLIVIRHPAALPITDSGVQAVASAACLRALRRQAEQLLPQRLASLAEQHGFTYRSVRIKQLRSRWGSCDQQQNISLNLYLMQLPWECIDYVLLHELTHTRVMRHGPPFWAAMAAVLPEVQARRRAMRRYQPVLATATGRPAAVA